MKPTNKAGRPAAALAASEVGAIALMYSQTWNQIAIIITRAWGYTG
jgi:hypothetical protein